MAANRLAAETSPYLLQHSHNPVDWYPWGDEALERARAEDRPIFLSVGYAACHWCHVMERESFEDERTAAMLNDGFVAIKVDREERPDIDGIYMAAVQAMTGSGGWPMNVFLTPDGRPFFGGTYFPAQPRYGMPSFRQVLDSVSRAWRERRAEIESAASELAGALRRQQAVAAFTESIVRGDVSPTSASLDPAILTAAENALVSGFERDHGGWSGPPRFPQPAIVELLLRRHDATGNAELLEVARRALDVMAAGGIRDHLGGGFHRYATDTNWLVPHFEKMLYDNAQLARAYLHAFEATREPAYRAVVEETLDYMARDLVTADGLLAASEDADTDGVEGATYVWTLAEVEDALGPLSEPATALFVAAYGVTERGNWEGRTILSRVRDDASLARDHGLEPDAVAGLLAHARDTLAARRRARPQPGRDDKAIAAWNGLALAAFADAIPVLRRQADRAFAERLAAAILERLRGADGRLARSYRAGRRTGRGMLEDYGCVAEGLFSLYEATFDERWLVAARELADAASVRFADPAGGWFDTPDDAEQLLYRPKELQDGATPSGGAALTLVLLRLAELTGEGRQRTEAERALHLVEPFTERFPLAFAAWLVALDFAVGPVTELAVVGDPERADTAALVGVARRSFAPRLVVAAGEPATSTVELLQGRFALDGRATAFVCRDFACRQPVTEPEALAAQLA